MNPEAIKKEFEVELQKIRNSKEKFKDATFYYEAYEHVAQFLKNSPAFTHGVFDGFFEPWKKEKEYNAIRDSVYELLFKSNSLIIGDVKGYKGYILTSEGMQILYSTSEVKTQIEIMFSIIERKTAESYQTKLTEITQMELNLSQANLNTHQRRINRWIVGISALAVGTSAVSIYLSCLTLIKMDAQTLEMKTNNKIQQKAFEVDSINNVKKEIERLAVEFDSIQALKADTSSLKKGKAR